jgi:hypothetical protein
MFFWTAEPMTAPGPRKGEPSSCSMRNGLRPQPARLVRGSSRRIMTMRFRPANIRVINRRVSSSAVIGPAVGTKERSKLTSRNVFPLRRPSKISVAARTVLTGKGSLRRAKTARPCPLRAVPANPILRRAAPAGTLHNYSGSKSKDRLASLRGKAGLTSGP